MAVRGISDSGGFRWVRPADASLAPGVWAARLRFVLDRETAFSSRFAAHGAWELFLDGESISRSASDGTQAEAGYDAFEFSLPSGRHELFARIWSLQYREAPPAFAFSVDQFSDLLATGVAPWVAARSENIALTSPLLARVLVDGEPTGPGGMDRGADWQPVQIDPDFDPVIAYTPATAIPFAMEKIEGFELVEGSGTIEEFRSVFGPDGFFHVEANESATIELRLPEGPILVSLRASGGEHALVRIWSGKDPRDADVFMPRGFRQDFSSLAPFPGGKMTIRLEGGERGMALFHLEFLRQIDV